MPTTTRTATPGDLDWITNELKLFSKFHNSKHSLFGTEEYSRWAFNNYIKNHLCLIAEKADKVPMGFIVGIYGTHPYNRELKVLSTAMWWVKEEFRNSRAGYILFKDFMSWGKRNADWVLCTLNKNTPIKETSLTKFGFNPHEKTYLLET